MKAKNLSNKCMRFVAQKRETKNIIKKWGVESWLNGSPFLKAVWRDQNMRNEDGSKRYSPAFVVEALAPWKMNSLKIKRLMAIPEKPKWLRRWRVSMIIWKPSKRRVKESPQHWRQKLRMLYPNLLKTPGNFLWFTVFCSDAYLSAHGIPRVYTSRNFTKQSLWLLLFFSCLGAFSLQAFLIVKRFFRNDIIVGVELKFEVCTFEQLSFYDKFIFRTFHFLPLL